LSFRPRAMTEHAPIVAHVMTGTVALHDDPRKWLEREISVLEFLAPSGLAAWPCHRPSWQCGPGAINRPGGCLTGSGVGHGGPEPLEPCGKSVERTAYAWPCGTEVASARPRAEVPHLEPPRWMLAARQRFYTDDPTGPCLSQRLVLEDDFAALDPVTRLSPFATHDANRPHPMPRVRRCRPTGPTRRTAGALRSRR